MPATTYYITKTNPQITVPIAAWAMARSFWREPKVYRDNFQPLKVGTLSNTGGSGVNTGAADVPVMAVESTVYTPGTAGTSLTVKAATPDNMSHTPHRVDWVPKSGYAFALADGVSIPTPPVLNAAQAAVFNGASATDIFTLTSGTQFNTGDIVTAGTAGNGLTTTALYTFVKIDATTGKLMLNGAIVDVSGTITGVTLALVTASALPSAVADVYYVEDPVVISTSEPL